MPRLAIAQIRPAKGEYAANVQRIGGVLAQLAKLEPAVDLVVFPETATSGYFVEGGVRDVAVTAGTLFRDLSVRHDAAHAPPPDRAVGADPSHAGRGARRVRRVLEPRRVRGGEGVPGRVGGGEPGGPDRAARAAVRGSGAHRRYRSRGADESQSGRAAASGSGGESPASTQRPRETRKGKREREGAVRAVRPREQRRVCSIRNPQSAIRNSRRRPRGRRRRSSRHRLRARSPLAGEFPEGRICAPPGIHYMDRKPFG